MIYRTSADRRFLCENLSELLSDPANVYTVRSGNGSATILPLEVSTQRNFVADVIRLNLNFIHKTINSLFEPPFVGVRGYVRTSSIAQYKAPDRLPIRYN